MVSPLISALLGAGEQYMADEDASDQLKGDIIDAASKKYFDVELPQQKGVINAMKEVKRAIANEYGNKVADIGDNYGYFEDGNLDSNILKDSHSPMQDYNGRNNNNDVVLLLMLISEI